MKDLSATTMASLADCRVMPPLRSALYRRIDPETKAYLARRVSEGKSVHEAIRCPKRYLPRSLYRQLEAMPTNT